MKSRTFYSEYSKTQFKKQVWIMGLAAFFLFLILPVALVIDIGNMEYAGYTLYERQRDFTLYALRSELLLLAVMSIGFLIASYQFSYLHSRKKVDFFHSFPVRKEKIYMLHAGSAYLDFAVPFTAVIAVSIMLGLARGLATWEAIEIYTAIWLFYQVAFLVSYSVTAVAMLLTGREFVGVIGAFVLLFLPVTISALVEWYQSEFFLTYSGVYRTKDWLLYLSPGCTPWQVRSMFLTSVGKGDFFSVKLMLLVLAAIAFAAGFFLVGYVLMKKRPSEAAGSSMAFSIPARVILVVLSIIGALYTGLFVYSIAGYYNALWLFAGGLFGGFVLYIFIQFIYTIDFRKVLQHKWQLVLVEVTVCLVMALFCFDWIGYDSYIPVKGDLYSVAISIPDDYHYQSYYIDETYVDGQEYRLEHMNLLVTDELYQMLAETAEYNGAVTKDHPWEEGVRTIQVRYKLKNGRIRDRSYYMNIESYRDVFISLYDQAEFKDNLLPMYGLFTQDSHYKIHLKYENEEMLLFGNDQKKAYEFIEVLKADFEQRKGSTFVEEVPIASIKVNCEKLKQTYELLVYPSSTRVISYLEESGYPLESRMTAENILKIEIQDDRIFDKKDFAEGEEVILEGVFVENLVTPETEWNDTDSKTTVYTEKEKIEQILPALIDYSYESLWVKTCNNINVMVTYIGKDGYQIQCGYALLEDRLPEFLKR